MKCQTQTYIFQSWHTYIFVTGVACQQGMLTLPDIWFRPPFWDLLMLQLLRAVPPPMRAWGVKSRMCPPYPQRDRKRRLNGAVCRNHSIKRVVPCRC